MKVNWMIPLSFPQTLYYLCNFKLAQPNIMKSDILSYRNYEDLCKYYKELPKSLKLHENESITNRTLSTTAHLIYATSFLTIRHIYTTSILYDHKNEELSYFTKITSFENQDMNNYSKQKKEKININNKEKKMNIKGEIGFIYNVYKKIDANRTLNKVFIIFGGYKHFNKTYFKIAVDVCTKGYMTTINKLNKMEKKEVKFSDFDKFYKETDNIFYKQIYDLNINNDN
jgi:hypothetical protein